MCGTDLGLLKTKAIEQKDGTYKISGQKIFITSGDHDLTENIIHLVIARAADSPAGTKGISLFLVPKFLVKDDGSIGPRNGVSTGSIETKMGIKGSATCVLNFDNATGYMIGPKNKGLNSMFTMMNLERIVVGIQGLGLSEIAYQNSLNYAKERKQGKSNNTKLTNGGADFILDHADIRKSLLTMKSIIEGERALCFWLSQQTEVSLNHTDEKVKEDANDMVSLMTPVVKSLFSDLGMEITSEAMQIHGGYGYTKDQGIEQLYRDNRITPIYEGTNSVQAIDLVFRKVLTNRTLEKFTSLVQNEIKNYENNDELKRLSNILEEKIKLLLDFSNWLDIKLKNQKDDVSAACNDFLKVLGYVALGYSWLKMTKVSYENSNKNKEFYEEKINTAKYFFDKILPRIDSHYHSAIAGSESLMKAKFN